MLEYGLDKTDIQDKESGSKTEKKSLLCRERFLRRYIHKISIVLEIFLVLSIFYTLYFARVIILPIIIALILHFLLTPLVRTLKKVYIPEYISALLIIIIFLGIISGGIYNLWEPTRAWLEKSPQMVTASTAKVNKIISPVVNSIKPLSKINEFINNPTEQKTIKNIQVVTNNQLEMVVRFFSNTSGFFMDITVIILLTYFLLASGDFFLRKMVEVFPHLQEKKEVVNIVHAIEQQISVFLVTKTVTSIGLALALSISLFYLHMPNAILWGIVAGLLEFIPYLGVFVGTIAITLTALFTFDHIGQILLVPFAFFTLSSITGNIISPIVMGKSLRLNPIVIFIGLIFWGWIWGLTGALIAIPLISIFKIICDNVKSLNWLSDFLSE